MLPFLPRGPGEKGRAVHTKAADDFKVKQGYNMVSFNQYVSDQISVERKIPDSRPKT